MGGEGVRVKVRVRKGKRCKRDAEAFLGLSGPFSPFLHQLKKNGCFLQCPVQGNVAEFERNFIVKLDKGFAIGLEQFSMIKVMWWRFTSDLTNNPKQRRIDLPKILLH